MKHIIPVGYSRDIWVVFSARVVTSVGYSVSMPYLSLYLHNELKIPMTIVGIILMLASVIGALLGVYGGELSDRMGRKWVMVRSLAWRCVIFVLMGYIIAAHPNVHILTILLIINSTFGSFFIPASTSYVADLIDEDKRTSAYGLLRIGGNLGWALGPAIGGLLATIDYAYLFFVTGACMAVAAIVLLRFCKESIQVSLMLKDKPSVRQMFAVVADTRFFVFFLICLAIFIVWGQLVFPLAVFSVNQVGITQAQLGILFSINGLMVVVLQYVITNLIPTKRLLDALWIGSLIYAIGYFTVGIAHSFAFLIVSIVFITIAEMVVTPASLSYASLIADPAHKGRYMGFFNLAQSLGWSFAPLIGGIFLDVFAKQPLLTWGPISGLAVVAALGFFLFKSKGTGYTFNYTYSGSKKNT